MVTRQEVYNKGHREGAVKGGFRGCLGGLVLTAAAALPFSFHQYSTNRSLEAELGYARTTLSQKESEYNSVKADNNQKQAQVANLEGSAQEASQTISKMMHNISGQVEKLKKMREEQNDLNRQVGYGRQVSDSLKKDLDDSKREIKRLNITNSTQETKIDELALQMIQLASQNEDRERRAADAAKILLPTVYTEGLLNRGSTEIYRLLKNRINVAMLTSQLSPEQRAREIGDEVLEFQSYKDTNPFFYTNKPGAGERLINLFFDTPHQADRVEIEIDGRHIGYFEIPASFWAQYEKGGTAFIGVDAQKINDLDYKKVAFAFFKLKGKEKKKKDKDEKEKEDNK